MAYVKNATWATGDIITATKLNNLETQYDEVKAEVEKIDGTSAIKPDWSNIGNRPATFTPSAHKASHASGGTDALTPADIGAVNKAGDTMTGQLKTSNSTGSISSGGVAPIEVISTGNSADGAYIAFHRPNFYASYFGIDTDNKWKVGGWSAGANAYEIWHAGNDGAGSGLDADTLDGKDSSAFALAGSGPQVAHGSYAGSGSGGTRTITVGFTPRLVFITRLGMDSSGTGAAVSYILFYDGTGGYLADTGESGTATYGFEQDANKKIVTNGFVVSWDAELDYGSRNYGWTALA